VRGLGKGVSGKPYPRLCNARRPRLEPETFRSQAVRLPLAPGRPFKLESFHQKIIITNSNQQGGNAGLAQKVKVNIGCLIEDSQMTFKHAVYTALLARFEISVLKIGLVA
jgi:hypothetical protein